MLQAEECIQLQNRIHYQFKDKALLEKALTHKSAYHLHNERLEYLGDSILNFIVAQELYQLFPDANEGELTRARASLVNKPTLAQIARQLDIGRALKLGAGERKSGGFRRESILADALEALIAAIYLDSSLDKVVYCIQLWYGGLLRNVEFKSQKDPKTRLQEWLQSQQKQLPKYNVQSIFGEPHHQTFIVECVVEGFEPIIGEGDSRRIAEQNAASLLLEKIENV